MNTEPTKLDDNEVIPFNMRLPRKYVREFLDIKDKLSAASNPEALRRLIDHFNLYPPPKKQSDN